MGITYDTDRENGPDYLPTRRRIRSRRRKRDRACPDTSGNTCIAIKHELRPRRRTLGSRFAYTHTLAMAALLLLSMATSTCAAFINFENCLDRATVESDPLMLQFIPHHVWAVIDTGEDRNLNITVYGNVSGIATQEPYPAPDDPQWSDPDETLGKIVDLSVKNNKYSTLITKLNVLSFTPHEKPSRFCDSVIQGECPLGPVFDANASDPSRLRAFSIEQELFSTYAFSTITANLRIASGDVSNAQLACISANITPGLGSNLRNLLTYLPLSLLVLVGFATAFAAIFSPWGSSDLFRWTSNYGRDEDLLRLVTPGFADCLQYIQFVVLTGGLSLNYPGFYQPVVSQVSWATLMFNQSMVSHGDGIPPLVDGVYNVNGSYGLDRMSQLVGMTSVEDVWAGMVIWLLAILAGVIILIQLGFICRWVYYQIAHVPEEDLRSKNLPFTVGNVVRVVFNYFLLPIVSLSMFQLVIAADSPQYTVALAVILIMVLIGFAAWLLYLIASTRPRSFLFDDLPTVLLYGPLYNTFSDDAAPFALIPVLLTFIRGIAIGAIQPSGIAQLVLLAVCEVILALTLNAFRPFHSPTSMNAYHTFFAAVRFFALLLSVAFLPSLGIGDSPRGFIGYVILFMHAIVLVFGFFLNAAQTLIEVIARLAGAGGEGGVGGGAARGGLVKVFGMRQLSRRVSRRKRPPRHSTNSEAAILGNEADRSSAQIESGRGRSLSGSTAFLLNRANPSDGRISTGFETSSGRDIRHSRGSGSGPYSPTTPAVVSGLSHGTMGHRTVGSESTRGEIIGLQQTQTMDPYYRPPRQRRATFDPIPPAARSRGSWAGGDWMRRTFGSVDDLDHDEPAEGPSMSRSRTPVPAYLGAPREDPDEDNNRDSRTDYAVREVDFYYRVRGPALGNVGSRKLKTGPADPTGPVSSATGWFKGLFGGKTKDKAKGFEVVRSARAPPPGLMRSAEVDRFQEPYQDEPEDRRSGDAEPKEVPRGDQEIPAEDAGNQDDAQARGSHELAQLPSIESASAIELPSRIGSRSSTLIPTGIQNPPPTIPRKSSKRLSSTDMTGHIPEDSPSQMLHAIASSSSRRSHESTKLYDPDDPSQRNPQGNGSRSDRLPFGSKGSAAPSSLISTTSTSSTVQHSMDEEQNQVYKQPKHVRHSSVLGHFASDTQNDRPSSVGFVQQHRASDNITEASPEEATFTGSTAEFIGSPLQRERS